MGELIPFPARPGAPTMFCAGCGVDRTVPTSAADPGACACGSTIRVSVRPPLQGDTGFCVRIRAFGGLPAVRALEAGSWGPSGGSWGLSGGTPA